MRTSNAFKGLTMLALGYSLMILGCNSIPTTAIRGAKAKPDACLTWQDIDYSAKSDTPETVQAVRVNNAKRESYCQ